MKINKCLSGLFAFLSITLCLGFPRIYGTEIPMALFLLPFYIIPIQRFISQKSVIFFLFFALALLWFSLGCVSYAYGDGVLGDLFFHFILFIKLMMNVIFGLIVYIAIKKHPKMLLAWLIMQCIIIFISTINYNFYIFLLGFISPRSADVFSVIFGLRAVGFGLFHMDGSILLVTAGLFYYILDDSKFKKNAIIMLLFPISMSLARSAIIPFTTFGMLTRGVKIKIFMLFLVCLMCILSLTVTSGPFYQATELFRNFVNSGEIKSTSASSLSAMYIFPTSVETYLFGDGRYYGDLVNQLSFYKSTDIGYLRLVYFSGVFSLLMFMVLNLYFLFPLITHKIDIGNFDLRYLSLGLILIFIIVNFKGIQMGGIFVSTLYWLAIDIKRKVEVNYP